MAEFEKLNDQELEDIAGGIVKMAVNEWKTIARLQTGVLAMRTQPNYDYSNEIKGAELYNGDKVQIKGAPVQGTDGRTYVKVLSKKSGKTGYVNASFIM